MNRIAFVLAALTLTACDAAAPADHRAASYTVPGRAAVCPEGLADLQGVIEAHHEQLACLVECDAVMLECLQDPGCHACEHERAICRSECPMGAHVP